MEWIKVEDKLPKAGKPILLEVKNHDDSYPNPTVVGMMKHPAGVKEEYYFVRWGMQMYGEEIVAWSDCLPEDFKFAQQN